MVEVLVCMPCFNAADTITRSASSVFAQSFNNFHLIIVDDCSNDGTAELLIKMETVQPNVSILKNCTNRGPAFSRQKAIEFGLSNFPLARYFAFIDADDSWHVTKLQKQIEFMENNGYDLSFHRYIERRVCEGTTLIIGRNHPQNISRGYFFENRGFGLCLTGLLTKKLALKLSFHRYFSKNISEDFCYFADAFCHTKSVGFLHNVLGEYNVRAGSRSSRKVLSALSLFKYYLDELGLIRGFCSWWRYVISKLAGKS